jgi:hypothetical protein
MATRVILHIGPRKTATTYLQRVMQALVESDTLDAQAYPIRTRGGLDHNQVPGLIDLARSHGEIGLQADAWNHQDGSDARALLEAVARAPGEVILSAEALSVLRPSGAACIIEALAPAPVDVVVTVRDLARVLPSSWQQHMRNGNIESYADYLALRKDERESRTHDVELHRGFWRAYRYGELVRRWAEVARSVAVVTVPPSGADTAEVWRRFVEACQVPGLPTQPPTIEDDRANVSLTGAETFALQGLNVAARGAGWGRREVREWHRKLLRRGWTQRPDRGHRLGLPSDIAPLVQQWAAEDRRDLEATGAQVLGTLEDLMPTVSAGAASPGTPDATEVAVAAGAAMLLLGRKPVRESPADDDALAP